MAGGGRVRTGALVRTESLTRLTEAGQAALLAHGVATIVDLRAPFELIGHPNPFRDHSGYRSLPFMDDAAMAGEPPFDSLEAMYGWMLATQGPRVAAIVRGMADAPPGGVLVHCAAGKDRTGIVAALALAVAGVERDAIADDYALSRWWTDRMLEEWLALQPAADRYRLRIMNQPRPEIVLAMLGGLDEAYGGVAAYLGGIGVGEDVQERLRARLV